MRGTASEPIDHHRTTLPVDGEPQTEAARMPGLLFVGAAMVAFVVCLGGFAARQVGVGVGAVIVMLLTAGAALAWLTMEGRRVREVQRQWSRTHRSAG